MRFSLITPSLNQGRFLPECLRSVQTSAGQKEIEHLVIDGGSIDASVDVLTGQTFARWISEPDRGQSAAINKGLVQSKGEILSYLCADDFLEPGALDLVDAAFRENPAADFVYGDAFFLEGDSGWKRLKRAGEFSVTRLRRGNFLLQPAVFWRRRVYEHFGGFDETLNYCMDHEYWLRTSSTMRWKYLPHPLATCRLHPDAKTSRALALAWAESAQMQLRYGICYRPRWEAWWMQMAGGRFYTFKRRLFAGLGKFRKSSP